MTDVDADGRAYLEGVMAEIEEEVQRRRASGDLPARVERELDELFLEFSPVAGRGGSLTEALRLVDGAAFIDPVVPVASDKSGGAVVKKGVRTISLWYMGFVTHQVSQFASAVSRALHLLDEELIELRRQVEVQRVPPAPVVEVGWAHGVGAWWVPEAVKALTGAGRVLHAAAGDGWLVRRLGDEGIDAYGVEPREGRIDRAELEGTDLREESLVEHLRAIRPATLGGLVLTGVVDGPSAGERDALLELVADRLAPDATLVVHSLSPAGWLSDDMPPEVDLSPGRPLRATTWQALLGAQGFEVAVEHGPEQADYLVVASRRGGRPAKTAR
jgi:hypothetical protein